MSLLFIIMLFIVAAHITGCICCSDKSVRIFLGIAAGVWILLSAAVGMIIFEISYKITDVDASESPDGEYALYFQQVGEPDFPFGNTHARLVLKSGHKTIAKYSFDISNDGGNIHERNWQVLWNETYVSVLIFGDEQNDCQYDLYFDGTVAYAFQVQLVSSGRAPIDHRGGQKFESIDFEVFS